MKLLLSTIILISFLGLDTKMALADYPIELCAKMSNESQKLQCYTQAAGRSHDLGWLYDCRLLPLSTDQVTCYEESLKAGGTKKNVYDIQSQVLLQFSHLCGQMGGTEGANCLEYTFGNSTVVNMLAISNSIYTSCKNLQRPEVKISCFQDGIKLGLKKVAAEIWNTKLATYFKKDCSSDDILSSIECYHAVTGGSVNSSPALSDAYDCTVNDSLSINDKLSCIEMNLEIASSGY